jgi:hypothetical protein
MLHLKKIAKGCFGSTSVSATSAQTLSIVYQVPQEAGIVFNALAILVSALLFYQTVAAVCHEMNWTT